MFSLDQNPVQTGQNSKINSDENLSKVFFEFWTTFWTVLVQVKKCISPFIYRGGPSGPSNTKNKMCVCNVFHNGQVLYREKLFVHLPGPPGPPPWVLCGTSRQPNEEKEA